MKRTEIWKHNALFGAAGMIKANALRIVSSQTATYKAKKIARQIHELSIDLGTELKTRTDQVKE